MECAIPVIDNRITELGEKILDKVPMELDQAMETEELKSLVSGLPESSNYHTERLLIEFSTKIAEIMRTENITKTELAKRLNKPKGFVKGILAGSRQIRIRHMVEILMALGYCINIEIVEKKCGV